jgi:putative phosphoribosyl transferase
MAISSPTPFLQLGRGVVVDAGRRPVGVVSVTEMERRMRARRIHRTPRAGPSERCLDLQAPSVRSDRDDPARARSASSRRSSRNRAVAQALTRAGFGALLIDLLTESEAQRGVRVFDIPLLSQRVAAASRWTGAKQRLAGLTLGLFGASTGAEAALGELVRAVVSRAARRDLAAPRLAIVTAPTLLIVGGRDSEVLELIRRAADALRCPHEFVVVSGAGHLFEEPGALDALGRHPGGWFGRYVSATTARAA